MRLTSRKFILSVLTLASCHWLLVEQLLSSADFKTLVLGTVGVYVAGNVAQKAVAKTGGAA